MKSATKRKVGRPSGQRAPHRPVLAARVPAEDYDRITAAAKVSGRTVSEEAVWRIDQSFKSQALVAELHEQLAQWERAHKDAQTMVAKAKFVTEQTAQRQLEDELRRRGYTYVRGTSGAAWFDPGVDHIVWISETSTGRKLIEALIERGATRALEKLFGRRLETPESES